MERVEDRVEGNDRVRKALERWRIRPAFEDHQIDIAHEVRVVHSSFTDKCLDCRAGLPAPPGHECPDWNEYRLFTNRGVFIASRAVDGY